MIKKMLRAVYRKYAQKQRRLGKNREYYLLANLDAMQVDKHNQMSVEKHFKKIGYDEIYSGKRIVALGLPFYDEALYLAENRDVKHAIALGHFSCAFKHYLEIGFLEMLSGVRPLSGNYSFQVNSMLLARFKLVFNYTLYLQQNSDLSATTFEEAWQHFCDVGIYEVADGSRCLYPQCPPFNAIDYVGSFKDVFDALKSGVLTCPYEHFFLVGAQEIITGKRVFLKKGGAYFYYPPIFDKDVAKQLISLEVQPKISIIMPVYNVEVKWLKRAVNSIVNQWYQHWQLCICDDASTRQETIEYIQTLEQADSRINVFISTKNENISAASNKALSLAKGDFVALMDHDDELTVDALFEVVKQLQDKKVAFIYSDEDKVDELGKYFEPHFKCAWNLDLLYSQNYISHLSIYKTSIVRKIGGFREGFEGSQDYDLLLRYSREIHSRDIRHIDKVLYHWRAIEGSTAMLAQEKSYTTQAGLKALSDHFNELDIKVTVEQGKYDNLYKVNWPIATPPLVSLIIPTYNGYEITKQAIDSILNNTSYQNFEILLVDNNSDDEKALAYFDKISQHASVNLLRYPQPFNYSAINNFAVSKAKGEIVGLINNDIEVINSNWLTEMVSHAIRPDIGCVGAMLYYPDDTIQHAGVILGIGGVAGHSHKYFAKHSHGYFERLNIVQNLSAVTAACLVVKKSIYAEVNGLNEQDLTVAFNDVDFCLKVREAGYRNLWTPYAELYHHESLSRGDEDNPEKIARFNKEVEHMNNTWRNLLQQDPCYSPHLTLNREDFSLK